MGRKGRGRAKAAQPQDANPAPVDRGALASCLNATSQIAAECNSILRDLLRGRSPQHQDLQRLASQVLMGQTMNLQELQKKMESQQATLAELLKVLKPAAGPGALGLGGGDAAYALAEPSLSVVRGWDSLRDGACTAAGAAAAAARRQRRPQKGHPAARPESTLSKRERYAAVEGFWRSLTPEARRALLAAPVRALLEAARGEGGDEGAREVLEGVALLKHSGCRHACYWRCPCCDARTADPAGFLAHLRQYHEEVQYLAEDTPMLCVSCGQEVVGAFFHSGDPAAPPAACCLRCAWDARGGGGGPAPAGMRLHVPEPRAAPLQRTWSEGTLRLAAASSRSSSGDGDADADGDGSPSEGGSSEGGSPRAADLRALEARVRGGAEGLQAAIVERVDAIERADRRQFEVALTGVVQQAQRLMSGVVAGAEGSGSAEEAEARRGAAARLRRPDDFPDQPAELRASLCLLTPCELQDLLALLARLHSPAGGGGRAHDPSAPAPPPPAYEPMCSALLELAPAAPGAPPGKTLVVAGRGLPLPAVCETEEVAAAGWWVDHLAAKGWQDLGSRDDAYLLQWVYGSVAHGATEDFAERQRAAAGGRPRDAAVVEALGEVAETWRHLAATLDRKRHVSTLRDAVAEDVQAVESFEGADLAALRAQAADFFADLAADPSLAAPPPPPPAPPPGAPAGAKDAPSSWSQRALGRLQRFHQLKDESSIRYAQALIDREIAVLELAEVMEQHEVDAAEREMAAVGATLGAARAELGDAEAELARATAGGPAAHRKRDLLDKVNKEAEHRERTGELHAHIAACRDRIAAEEAFGGAAGGRREAAVGGLLEVRAELAAQLERRAALDAACHDVLAAQERDRGQELTDAYVDARIRAVWQVVTGVAGAIRGLADRYAPGGGETKEAARHARSTGLAKSLSADLDDRIRVWWDDLDKLRRRAADLACVDAGPPLEAAALEAARRRLEAAAAAAREAATLDLLAEVEAEEEAKRAAESKRARKKAGRAATAAAATAGGKDKGGAAGGLAADDEGEDEDEGEEGGGEGGGDGEGAERRAEAEYEAALERRRQELERQEAERARQEAELVRAVQAASLKEGGGGGGGGGGVVTVVVPSGRAAKAAARAAAAAQAAQQGGGKAGRGGGGAAGAAGAKSPEKAVPRVVLVHRTVPGTPARAKAAQAAADSSGKEGGGAPPPPPPPPPGKPAAGAPARSGKDAAPAAAAGGGAAAGGAPGGEGGGGEMRITSYFGDWACFCGRGNRLWDTCVCGQVPPCRDWVRGRCTYRDRCRFQHPPFELPDSLPRPKSPIAKPGSDAVVYRKGKVVAGGGGGAAAAGRGAPQVGTPEARPAAAPKGGGPASPAPPPPIKLAPWAGVKPGAAVQEAAPPGAGAGPAPRPPPGHPRPAAPPLEVHHTPAPPPPPAPAAAPGGGGFDLFGGGNPLLQLQLHQAPGGGGGGGLGFAGLGPPSPQLRPPAAAQLFDRGGGGGGGFLSALGPAPQEAPASVTYTSGVFSEPGAAGGGGGGGGALHYGSGGLGGLTLEGGVLGGGAGGLLGALGGGGGGGGGEEWGALELQLPSDLGEMLGADPGDQGLQLHLSQHAQAQQQAAAEGAPSAGLYSQYWGAAF